MNEPAKILVLLDGSDRALDAVRYVASVGGFSPLTVVVLFNVHAQFPQSYLDLEKRPASPDEDACISTWLSAQETRRLQYMEKARLILEEGGIEDVKILMQQLSVGVARDITAEARQEYAAVVMTRRGMGLLAGLPIGSVANKLLHKISFAPVILAVGHAVSDRVLIAVDGSPDSYRAVSFAGDMLNAKSRVMLVHVIRNHPGTEYEMTEGQLKRAKDEMVQTFAKMKRQLQDSGFGPDVISEKIIERSPSRAGAILEEATSGRYDTIVLGRKGLSRVEDFSMGRVSTKIVQMADNHALWLV